jgi:hypothetical protein
MLHRFSRFVGLLLLSVLIFSFMGCGGSKTVLLVEEGYMPTHFAVGDIIVYTGGDGSMKASDVKRILREKLEREMRTKSVRYIPFRKLEASTVDPTKVILVEMALSFTSSTRDMTEQYDVNIDYKLTRQSDGYLWSEGEASSTDATVSRGASVDLNSGIIFVCRSLADQLKAKFQ